MTEDEICERIMGICDGVRLTTEGITGKKLMKELDLL